VNRTIRQAGWTALACATMALPAWAENAGKPVEKTREELEQRVEALERKIQDLESMLEQRNAPRRMQRFGRDADELWNRFQRDFQERFDRDFEMDWGPFGRDLREVERKPRLGVQMAPVSEDLVERYKNPVKEGVFITDVVPGSPAESAGIMTGDAITSFNNKPIKQPQDLIEAVRAAPKGKTEVTVTRKGEGIKLNVTLAEAEEEAATDTNDLRPHNWLRRDNMNRPDAMGGRQTSKTEVRASALELNEKLAADLKLNDEQKKKMGDILARHSKALSDEVASSASTRSRRGSLNMQVTGDIAGMAQKHADAAEKDLANVLSADQLKQWNDWRRTHNSVSMSHSMMIESSGTDDNKTGF